MDAYASPLFLAALNRAREAVVDPTSTVTYAAPALAAIGADEALDRWEPWVRSYLATQELLQPITFKKLASGGTDTGLEMLVSGASNPVSIVKMERPQRAVFAAEIADVLGYAELRDDRAPEILTQIDSQLAFWASVVQMRGDMAAKTYELLNVALQLAIFVEMRFKHELGCWRPVNFSADVQPHITTPGHGSLPMGHAAQAYMTACILCKLADAAGARSEIRDMLMRHAFRMSFNRIVAGVHFPVDLPAGAALGMALGDYFISRCGASAASIPTSANLQPWTFDATRYTNNKITKANFVNGYKDGSPVAVQFAEARATQHLWSAAVAEWAKRQP